MYPLEAQRISESATRWRIFAWVLAALGAIAVVVLAVLGNQGGTRCTYYGCYGSGFDAGGFFLDLLFLGVLAVIIVAPLFLTGNALNGLSLVMKGQQTAGWAQAKATRWRIISWLLTAVGIILAILYAVIGGIVAGLFTDNSGGFAVAIFFVVALFWMFEIWPLFMLCRVMDGIGVLGGESTALSLGRPFPFQFPSGSPFQQPPPSGAIYQPLPPAVAPGTGPTMPLPPAVSPAGTIPPAVPPSFGMPAPAAPSPAPVTPQPMGGWGATHRVPLGGLPARRKPDPTLPMLMRIAEGVQLMVARQQGEWALVQTDQGWQAWVDGRRLEPIVPETPQ